MLYKNTVTQHLSTAEVARQAKVHKDTILRWLRAGLIPEPKRDRRGWRYFTTAEAQSVVAFAETSSEASFAHTVAEPRAPYLGRLNAIDWDFKDAKTAYLTHGIHPYPAKFIPQIPNALIQELSSVGDTVADVFCGSGTTLVEALTLKRNAIGVDANPLACLISRTKTGLITESERELLTTLVIRAKALGDSLSASHEAELFPSQPFVTKAWRPNSDATSFWFEPFVVEELAECLSWCRDTDSAVARNLALTAFSSIVVTVSKQDSDTRYVRRDKQLQPGEVFARFGRSLEQVTRAASEFSELVESRFACNIVEANILDSPKLPKIDLIVCSPPYPNAYSYHLYHMTRMLWLGMDQPRFKREEIGSHRKYSSNAQTAATADTFRNEFEAIMRWLARTLKLGGYAAFVVGDSTLKGKRINNADLISAAGSGAGFVEVLRIERTLQATRKAFNPSIGKIKTENILILQNMEKKR
jgi:site-specific DNA-methyltransferase (cytosine-N4-specific)